MFRILIALIIIVLLYSFWRIQSKKGTRVEKKTAKRDLAPGEMIACSKCSVFVLKSEAIQKGGKYYCSEKCAH